MVVKLNRTIVNFFTFVYRQPKSKFSKIEGVTGVYEYGMTYKNLEKLMKYFYYILIRNCSQKILIINQPYYESTIQYFLKTVPEGMKYRIDFIDKKQSNLNKIIRYMQPILNDLDINETIKPLFDIVDFFNKLTLGCKYKAEIEIDDFKNLGDIFSELRMKLSDDEALYRLNTLNGIYNLYTYSDNIEIITINRNPYGISIKKRIEKLLIESDVIDSSYQRHLFGIPHLFKKARIKYISYIEKILQNPHINDVVNSSKDIILTSNGISPDVFPDIPNISKYQADTYNPPIISLKKYRNMASRELFPHDYKQYKCFYVFKDLRNDSSEVADII